MSLLKVNFDSYGSGCVYIYPGAALITSLVKPPFSNVNFNTYSLRYGVKLGLSSRFLYGFNVEIEVNPYLVSPISRSTRYNLSFHVSPQSQDTLYTETRPLVTAQTLRTSTSVVLRYFCGSYSGTSVYLKASDESDFTNDFLNVQAGVSIYLRRLSSNILK